MHDYATITNRHYFDCSGQIILHKRAGVGGIKSTFQTHEIDLRDNKTTLGQIVVGENAMTGTGCLLLKGAVVPDRSVIAAGSIVLKSDVDPATAAKGLYGGVPARYLTELNDLTWWARDSNDTQVTVFDDTVFRQSFEKLEV
jgi:acetyltransferase-like isoleucine patch superfamily enzyme